MRSHGGASVGQDVISWPLLVGIHGGASLYNLVRIQGKDASWHSKELVSFT